MIAFLKLDFNPKIYHDLRLSSNNFIYNLVHFNFGGVKIRSIKTLLIKHRKIIVLTILLTLFLSSVGTALAKPGPKLLVKKASPIVIQVQIVDGHLIIKVQIPKAGISILADPVVSSAGADKGGDDDGIPYNDIEGGG